MRTWIVVPAAGGGARFGAARPKQYADLAGAPVLARTLERLATLRADGIFVALAPDDAHYDDVIGFRDRVEPLRCGGATRAATVRQTLRAIEARCDDDDWVLVHDAARPCVPADALARLVAQLRDDEVGGLLALPLGDTLKRATAVDVPPRVLRTEDRTNLWRAQTPQMFRYRLLVAAHARDAHGQCTDDAQAVEALAASGVCAPPRLVTGSAQNVKITFAEDLALAAAILGLQAAKST
jgi:2-C-methyl-D-erythritol 4-phosphate cytidylyltransferase